MQSISHQQTINKRLVKYSVTHTQHNTVTLPSFGVYRFKYGFNKPTDKQDTFQETWLTIWSDPTKPTIF